MMQFVKISDTVLDSIGRRIVKLLRFGKVDVQTTMQINAFGFDSHPVKDMIAVYSATNENGKAVIIGYLLKDQVAAIGESRMYSTDEDGVLKTYLHLKNDGTILLRGDTHNLVRYTPLNQGAQDFKTLVQAELTKIQTAITGLGGAYVSGTLTIDISGSKIDEIKTS